MNAPAIAQAPQPVQGRSQHPAKGAAKPEHGFASVLDGKANRPAGPAEEPASAADRGVPGGSEPGAPPAGESAARHALRFRPGENRESTVETPADLDRLAAADGEGAQTRNAGDAGRKADGAGRKALRPFLHAAAAVAGFGKKGAEHPAEAAQAAGNADGAPVEDTTLEARAQDGSDVEGRGKEESASPAPDAMQSFAGAAQPALRMHGAAGLGAEGDGRSQEAEEGTAQGGNVSDASAGLAMRGEPRSRDDAGAGSARTNTPPAANDRGSAADAGRASAAAAGANAGAGAAAAILRSQLAAAVSPLAVSPAAKGNGLAAAGSGAVEIRAGGPSGRAAASGRVRDAAASLGLFASGRSAETADTRMRETKAVAARLAAKSGAEDELPSAAPDRQGGAAASVAGAVGQVAGAGVAPADLGRFLAGELRGQASGQGPAAGPAAVATAHQPLQASGTMRELDVRLHPAELGAVTARIRMAGAHISVEIAAETPQARHTLAAEGDAIRQALEALGFSVDSLSIRLPDAAQATGEQQAAPREGAQQGSLAGQGAGGQGSGRAGESGHGQGGGGGFGNGGGRGEADAQARRDGMGGAARAGAGSGVYI